MRALGSLNRSRRGSSVLDSLVWLERQIDSELPLKYSTRTSPKQWVTHGEYAWPHVDGFRRRLSICRSGTPEFRNNPLVDESSKVPDVCPNSSGRIRQLPG